MAECGDCKDCKWWNDEPRESTLRHCRRWHEDGAKFQAIPNSYSDGYGDEGNVVIATYADYGCKQWEQKGPGQRWWEDDRDWEADLSRQRTD